MNPAAPSREAMHDLILLPPVSFWPATPAWFVLIALLLAMLGWIGWRAWRRWQRDAYRREALRELPDASPQQIAAILKRVALVAWPREQVAALSGAAWAAFLRRTAPRARLAPAEAEMLENLAYAPADAHDAARRWVRCHDPRA